MNSKKVFLFLLLIILIALAFRLPAILKFGSLWFDEIISLKIAQHNILSSWQYLKWENNPPLHYWFLHYWIKIFGPSKIALRLSSLLFSLLSIIAIYFLGKKLFNKQTGLMASFLLAISSFQLFLSMDARMYPMLLFFSLLSCYYFWQWLNQPNKKNGLIYVVFTLLAFYIHLTACFLFFAQNIYFIYHYRTLKNETLTWVKWLISQGIIILLFLPWLINFIIRSLSTLNSGAWYLHTSGQGFLLWQIPRSFIFFGYKIPLLELVALFIFGILFVTAFAKIYDWSLTNKEFKVKLNFTPAIIFTFILFLIPLGLGFLIQMWVTKYYLISVIGFSLLLARGFDNLNLNKNYKHGLVTVLLLLTVPFNLNVIKVNHHAWDQVGKYVSSIARPDDCVLVSAFVYELPFEYYYNGQAKITAYQPNNLEKDVLLKAIKYNWQPILTRNNLPKMQRFVGDKKRIIIINPSKVESIHKSNLVIDWFVTNRWRLIRKKQFGGFAQPTVLIFERPNKTKP